MNKVQSANKSPANITVAVWEPEWPQRCACCCEANDTTIEVEIKDVDEEGRVLYQRTWNVPYCNHYKLHVSLAQSLSFNTFLGPNPSLGSLLAIIVSLFLCGIFDSALPFIVTIVVILALLARYRWRGVQEGRRIMKAKCCCAGPAVVSLSHHQFRGEMHTFRFKNARYAEEFQLLNKAHAPPKFVS